MLIEIKHRDTGDVLFRRDTIYNSFQATVKAAKDVGVNLSCADLRGVDLSCADLRGVDLSYANLSCADLSCADLSYANRRDANLRGADLRGANLRGANLIVLTLPFWNVYVHAGTIRIGCKHFTKSEWAGFTDGEISCMDGNALEFWTKYKPLIMKAAEITGN